jgi:hypothetical protein
MKIPCVAMRSTAIALAALLFAAPAVPQPARFKTPSASVTGLLTQPQFSDWGYITRFGTAWANDAMAIYHQPLGAPGEVVSAVTLCHITTDGYATDPGEAGHQLQHAAVLAAYLHHKQVQFLVQGCAYDKPRIISVGVRD